MHEMIWGIKIKKKKNLVMSKLKHFSLFVSLLQGAEFDVELRKSLFYKITGGHFLNY